MPKSDLEQNTVADVKPHQTQDSRQNSDDHNIKTKLNQINHHRKELERLRKNIEELVDVYAQNSSLVSKAAALWGKLPWWSKLLIGVIFVVPLLVTGILTHIMALLSVSLCMLVMYTVNSFLLDNHHGHTQHDKEKLKQGLLGIVTIFDSVINCLETLREELAREIEKLHEENEILMQLRVKLTEEIELLTTEVGRLSHVSVKLDLTEEQLAHTATRLTEKTQEQTALIERYTAQLEQLEKEAECQQAQLAAEIAKLNQLNQALKDDLQKTKQVADILQGTVETLSNLSITDTEQRANFQKRLEDFVSNQELTLGHFAHSLMEVERKLRLTQETLQAETERFENLLNRQESQLDRIDRALDSYDLSSARVLNKVGFFPPTTRKDYSDEVIDSLNNHVDSRPISI